MSDSPDISDNDPVDDERLSALYGRASTEQPSASVDQNILAKARRDMYRPSRQSNRFNRWTRSLSAAAVLVLSVSVIFMIDKESPELLTGNEPGMDFELNIINQATTQAKKPARKEKPKQKKDVALLRLAEPAPRQEAPQNMPVLSTPTALPETTFSDSSLPEPATPESGVSGKTTKIIKEKAFSDKPAPAVRPQSIAPQESFEMSDTHQEEISSPREEQENLISAEQEPSRALRKNTSVAKKKIAAKLKARKKKTMSEPKAEKRQRRKTESTGRLSSNANKLSFSADRRTEKKNEPQENRKCKLLTEKECLISTTCTLRKSDTLDSYQCEIPTDPCEINFKQGTGTKETCESTNNCTFVPAECYCQPDTICICGGGKPAHCKSNKTH